MAIIAVGLAGGLLGIAVGGSISRDVGPFDARLSLRPTLGGDTTVHIPPLGTLTVDSHDGPLGLAVHLDQLQVQEARRIAREPGTLDTVGDEAAADLARSVVRLTVQVATAAMVGALLLGVLVFRRPAPAFAASLAALIGVAASGGMAASTFRPQALAEPTYSGLLVSAPTVVGNARDIVARFDAYRDQLSSLVRNVSELYAVTSTLPTYRPDPSTIRVLHVSDLHLNPAAYDVISSVVEEFSVDVVVDTGDITDHGSEPEARFVAGIRRLGVPYVYVRGNHDSVETAAAVAAQPNAVVLDRQAREVAGLTFLGAGDPRFTPDKTTRHSADDERAALERFGRELADAAATSRPRPDVVLVHDPAAAQSLQGAAPLVLSGHRHHRESAVNGGTLLLVEGSTGAAGLRGLETDAPTPIECSVLYFDRGSKRLQAYDNITLGGLGTSSADITRHVVGPPESTSSTGRP